MGSEVLEEVVAGEGEEVGRSRMSTGGSTGAGAASKARPDNKEVRPSTHTLLLDGHDAPLVPDGRSWGAWATGAGCWMLKAMTARGQESEMGSRWAEPGRVWRTPEDRARRRRRETGVTVASSGPVEHARES